MVRLHCPGLWQFLLKPFKFSSALDFLLLSLILQKDLQNWNFFLTNSISLSLQILVCRSTFKSDSCLVFWIASYFFKMGQNMEIFYLFFILIFIIYSTNDYNLDYINCFFCGYMLAIISSLCFNFEINLLHKEFV